MRKAHPNQLVQRTLWLLMRNYQGGVVGSSAKLGPDLRVFVDQQMDLM
jgi:hypothetical protein